MRIPLDGRKAEMTSAAGDHTLREDVVRGLLADPKTLPPKLFYDQAGAALFETICTLPEYYLTTAEQEILAASAGAIAARAGAECALLEYGSGAGVKVRLLLDAMTRPAAYVPIDISAEQLERVAREIAGEYPTVAVRPVCADYTRPVTLPPLAGASRRVAFFPGSTIGNFQPVEAAAFLRRIRRTVGNTGALVLGIDRVKPVDVLDAAYNDAAGVTAAFNLNMLAHINREFGGNFRLDRFRHRAFFNLAESRIEMHLVSVVPQVMRVAGIEVEFGAGETIWTESSYKYDELHLGELIDAAGFRMVERWTDVRERFWVVYLEPATS
ncbi:MAG: L-histidine N(alpha)-methyltransferase [Gemmatimonadota bacterium]